ncbi:DUF6650 family protein [Aquabacter cavernae]|uniref:DUF6650 family protein n=1 Tax=Aquabacter cavernae TaxID=2496029 RepID=UPI000F8EF37F|nr:DUF6650 family protein [Aquabacter cavernae]
MMSKARRAFQSLIGRLTGFSTPIFGVSWEPPTLERDVVRRLVTFLEDRRVLYVPYCLEIPSEVEASVLLIREELTRTLQSLPEASPAAATARALRAACRKFLDEPRPDFRNICGQYGRWTDRIGDEQAGFFVALGELRASFGIHVGTLAIAYGIDVEEELAAILPSEEASEA